jgi:hypothetical protein
MHLEIAFIILLLCLLASRIKLRLRVNVRYVSVVVSPHVVHAGQSNAVASSLVDLSPNVWKAHKELYRMIDQRFNEGELRRICYDLDVSYENLPGETKIDKALELVKHAEVNNRLKDLKDILVSERATVDWKIYRED